MGKLIKEAIFVLDLNYMFYGKHGAPSILEWKLRKMCSYIIHIKFHRGLSTASSVYFSCFFISIIILTIIIILAKHVCKEMMISD